MPFGFVLVCPGVPRARPPSREGKKEREGNGDAREPKRPERPKVQQTGFSYM